MLFKHWFCSTFTNKYFFNQTKSTMNISLEQAEKAVELGTKMNISIVDAGANILAFARMDGAWLGSADISLNPNSANLLGSLFLVFS
jgi:uncharacterized protein GlcG (DUF336 family)